MARKVFISFLGSSYYEECQYSSGEFISSKTRFVQQATLEWIKSKEDVYPDLVKILLTNGEYGSRKTNWDKAILERYNFQTKQKEPYIGLEKVLGELGINISAVDIPDGKNEMEIWNIFETVFEQLKKEDELYLDITHGFRYLPMLVVVMSAFAKKIKQITVAHISYGNYESRNKANNIAPFVDLLPLQNIQEEKGTRIEKIKQSYIDRINNPNPFITLKILVCGATDKTENDIWNCFKESFKKKFNQDPPKRILDTQFLNYKDAKKSNAMELIASDKYDYIIWGPAAHNISDKDGNMSIETFCSKNNLKANVFSEHKKKLSASYLKTTANQIVDDWYHKQNNNIKI
jgi:CRISPR-associated Csx2 family protein